jgi:myo-inositol-1(or 4)-monophosphatase
MKIDMEAVKEIVIQAGEMALEKQSHLTVDYKADQSLVTEADKSIELFIEYQLNRLYPGLAFVGEEYGWRGSESVSVWACDPIDGTTNYVFGLPFWGISIGLVEDGNPTAGVFYMPALKEMYWANTGGGAWMNGIALHVQDLPSIHVEDTLCLTSNALKVLNTEDVSCRIRCLGSIAGELAFTASGRLRGVVGLYEGIMDMAAALCMCFEAGCEIRHLKNGKQLDLMELLRKQKTDEPFVVAPPQLMQTLLNTIHVVRNLK